MKHEILRPIGVRITEVDPARLSAEDLDEFVTLLARHGVAVMPDREIDDDQFLAFLRSFGDLMFTEGESPVAGYPDLNVISNVGRSTPPKSTFHVDTTYIEHPPAYTSLRAVQVPTTGGQTLFSNQYDAYDTLPAEIRADIDGRTVTHVVTGLDGFEDVSARHPLVRVHPISGRKALYLSAPARCVAVSGTTDAEAATLIRYLVEHSTRPENVFEHSWSPGDVVIWDNRCVMHRADHSGVVGDRVMHRGMVAEFATSVDHRIDS
ncbi:TauD/TfdA family dioxygenase [Rhodococcus sp. H36-A4]|uniref:TauD/TfdA dioxygenase family protein n=1 Tax=Rhodococcus sp. H36-A4 TaxID=3004353 RepID=UPI0022AEEED4|nr:TauD/TfdA family dioxygenase [Rhodococcus sp. H36-A4]MCZ4076798.1 TauD/TfdA family dioxygenase [Rhodococcus sp. H36-A4]